MKDVHRIFKAGLVVMAVFAMAHFGGFLQSAYAARTRPEMAELTRLMRATKTSLLGFEPSILDFREYFSLNFSLLLLLAAGLGHVATRKGRLTLELERALSPIYALAMFLLLLSSAFFHVIQGMVTCAILTGMFGFAWWRSFQETGKTSPSKEP